MNIIITVENFDPNKGYLEYYLAKELTELGHKVYVFTFTKNNNISVSTLKEGFQVIRIPYFAVINGYHIPSFNGASYIIKIIKTGKPDVIHAQPLFSPLSLFFISVMRLFNYKIVGSLMTGTFLLNSIYKRIKFSFVKIITKNYLMDKIDLVFVKNHELMKRVTDSFDIQLEKFCVIPLGADPELFKFSAEARIQLRQLLDLDTNDIVIVYSGKITPTKDIDILIKTLGPIIVGNQKIKFLIVGKGDTAYINYLIRITSDLKISENVIFHPWVHRTKLSDIYSTSDIAVWPGGPSISIVEAASVGLPLIINQSPIEIYAIEFGNGFAFERGNINELKKYLEILINDEKMRREMGLKSRSLIEQKLNWKHITTQYLNAYNRVLNE